VKTLSLFSIGFRAENICQVLRDYQAGKPVNRFIMDDSARVIEECSQLIDTPVESLKENRHDYGDYLPLLYEAFGSASLDQAPRLINDIRHTIGQIAEAKPGLSLDVSPALSLFQRLSDLCILKANATPSSRASFL
jgi:hypothetical protein